MRVAVVGTGYVGLVTGACLAEIGHRVTCVEAIPTKLAQLEPGTLPHDEPGLEALVAMNHLAGQLNFSDDLKAAVQAADFVFITVETPALASGEPDLSAVAAVARGIGEALDDYKVIVTKSTVPVGSGDWVAMLIRLGQRTLAGAPPSPAFDVVSNPEFLRQGQAIADTFRPDRIVIGSRSARAIAQLRALYAPILEGSAPGGDGRTVPFIVTDPASAELIKYATNAFLATKVSFVNEIALLCERTGADISQVTLGMGHDRRIGREFLQAGIGWGGSCFPKDVAALVHMAEEYHLDAALLRSVQTVNDRQRDLVLAMLQRRLKILKGRTVALWGLAFDTDDLREAPALAMAQQLLQAGAQVRAYDPVAGARAKAKLPKLAIASCPYEAATQADAIVLATEWPQFAQVDFVRLRRLVRTPFLLDGRNALTPAAVTAAGFDYAGIGRS